MLTGDAEMVAVKMGEAGMFASSASSRSWGDEVEVARLRVGRGFRLELPSAGSAEPARLTLLVLLLRWLRRWAMMVLSLLFLLLSTMAFGACWSSSVTMTPLRFSVSLSRSSRRESVDDIEGNVACVCIDRGVLKFADGGRDLGTGWEPEGTTEVRREDGGVDIRE